MTENKITSGINIDEDMKYENLSFKNLNLSDQWILNRLNDVILSVDENMDKYEFVNVGSELYNFIWDDFCSWYIELSKVHLNSDNEIEKHATQETLIYVLNAIVRLLHPFMPFVTEEIYQSIPHLEESICVAKWPTVNSQFTNKMIIEISYSIQTKDINLSQLLKDLSPYIYKLCHARCIGYNVETSSNVAIEMIKGGNALIIELGDYIDLEAEIKRCENMLSNPQFISKAPQSKVDAEKAKLVDYQSKYDGVMEKLTNM